MKKFCQRSREDTKNRPDRSPNQPRQPPQEPEQPLQQKPHRGTQQRKIPRCPQPQPGCHVQADLSVLQNIAAEKEERQRRHPEGQVQDPAQTPEEEPEEAQNIIQKAQPQPRSQAEQKGQGLALGRKIHPRKRRPRKLVWGTSSSS